jgi:hypothetical protein
MENTCLSRRDSPSTEFPAPPETSTIHHVETNTRRHAMTTPSAPDHDSLPIPDYDHLPSGSLFHRIRTLDEEQLQQLVAYENAHAARLPVLQALTVRSEQLLAGAQPSGGDPLAAQPEAAGGSAGGSVGGSQTADQTKDVLFQGVPGEPRRPQSGRSTESK